MKKLNYILAVLVLALIVAWYIKGNKMYDPKDTAIVVVGSTGGFYR